MRELDVYPNRLFALGRFFERLEQISRMFLIGYGEGEPSARFDTFHARAEVDSVSNGALWMKTSAKQKSLFLILPPSGIFGPTKVVSQLF